MIAIEDTSAARLQASPQAVQRFHTLRYGLSVHWGLYSLIGRGEWVMHVEQIPVVEYEKLAPQFNPTRFNAQEWGDLMEEIGAEAFLITSKHHDGFAMFDSALSDYKVTNTPFGRDVIGELAEACHQRGIQLHFYYSLLDWHHPDYGTNWPSYVAYYQGQLRELLTNYGPIGGILFDGYWPRFDHTERTQYFKPGGKWDLAGTYDLIHSLQPDAMVVNNHHVLPLKGEDYQVWELDLPGENTVGFNTTEMGTLSKATWLNANKGWSYFKLEQQEVKPVEQLVNYVVDSAKRNATCWLNVGPTPEGEIMAEEVTALRAAGEQLKKQGVPART